MPTHYCENYIFAYHWVPPLNTTSLVFFSRPQFGSSAFLRLTQLLLAYSISITIHPRLTRQVQWSAVTVCQALLTNHHHLPLHHHHPAEDEDATGRCCRNYLMIMRASSYLTIITTSSVLLADGGTSLLR